MLDNKYLLTLTDVGIAKTCQEKCKNNSECKHFLHRGSDHTCWLKSDTNPLVQKDDELLLGPKQCPKKSKH